MQAPPTTRAEIHLVSTDDMLRETLPAVLVLEGFHPVCVADGASLLDAVRRRVPACIVLDADTRGIAWQDVLGTLREGNCAVPVIVLTHCGTHPGTEDEAPAGATAFVAKPLAAASIAARIRTAIAAPPCRNSADRASGCKLAAQFPGRDLLTPREYQVLALIAGGASNKEMGRRLGISPRTVEVHRAHIIGKLGAKNTVDLVQIVRD